MYKHKGERERESTDSKEPNQHFFSLTHIPRNSIHLQNYSQNYQYDIRGGTKNLKSFEKIKTGCSF